MICPTVTIETKNGPVVINESDFDKGVHKKATPAAIKKAAAKTPAPELTDAEKLDAAAKAEGE